MPIVGGRRQQADRMRGRIGALESQVDDLRAGLARAKVIERECIELRAALKAQNNAIAEIVNRYTEQGMRDPKRAPSYRWSIRRLQSAIYGPVA